MQLVVLGPPETETEFRQKFSDGQSFTWVFTYEGLVPLLDTTTTIVFDFLLAEQPEQITIYAERTNLVVFCEAAKTQLAALAAGHPALKCHLFGFNGLPSFLNRPVLEVSLYNPADISVLQWACAQLGTGFLVVADRVGMITPRVVAMIINEACYTLQEKTATQADIDLSMKLGTNYPFGPFEWANRIGIKHVYELLAALYADTKDECYKICPLLKTRYLRQEYF
jgi:3-hydroxybutyryl-CoA dehydrogenase